MMRWNGESVYGKALNTFGSEAQVMKAIEELSELIKCLAKGDREGIIEEIADVEIILIQMKMLFDIDRKIWGVKKNKLERLRNIISEELEVIKKRPYDFKRGEC